MNRAVRPPAFRLPVSPDDVVRHALAAYYRAVGDAIAPIGEPDRAGWSNPAQFLELLADFFQLRLHHEAAMAGHPVEADSERYLRWSSTPVYGLQHLRDVDPVRWAELGGEALYPADLAEDGKQAEHLADVVEEQALRGAGAEPLRVAAMDGRASAPGACPPASAVGPAPEGFHGRDITINANPLLAVPSMQKLPGVTPGDTLNQSGEKLP